MLPVLSICIPTFERARYLEVCLDHLAVVTSLPLNIEIVVSDNASTDDTEAVVGRAKAAGLPVRYLRQRENVGAEANVVSALRAARGEFCVYLGDDDRLVMERVIEIIDLFQHNSSLVCVQAPWESWDDQKNENHGPFYELPAPACFTADTSWNAFVFLLSQEVFPEIGVYRTRALHAVLHLPKHSHWAFVWFFRLLGQGAVAFMPTPFYRHVVRARADLPARSQIGVRQAVVGLDRYRGGMEWGLAAALRSVAGSHIPREKLDEANRLLTGFIASRAGVAARVSAKNHDFIGATEFFGRSLTWRPHVELPALHRFEQGHTMLAALQAVFELASTTAGVRRLILCDVDNSDNVLLILRQVFGYTDPVEQLAIDETESQDDAMVLVMDRLARAAVVANGVLPGRVIVW
ncbi:MAG: hypothetical protein ACI9MC_001708, partial [Kiritimatiellia bacterium]